MLQILTSKSFRLIDTGARRQVCLQGCWDEELPASQQHPIESDRVTAKQSREAVLRRCNPPCITPLGNRQGLT